MRAIYFTSTNTRGMMQYCRGARGPSLSSLENVRTILSIIIQLNYFSKRNF